MTKNDLVVLGLLKEQPMHGYQIKHQIEERNLDNWANVSLPSIYNTLIRLEKRGLIAARREKVGKRPHRTVYRITPRGSRELALLVEKALVMDKVVEREFTVGVAFMYGLDKGKVKDCLQMKLKLLQNRLAHPREELLLLHDQGPLNWAFLLRNTVDHIQLEIDYLEKFLQDLKKTETWGDLLKGKGEKKR